jgi:uncharacterized protein YgiM (DUF1202 family)
MAFRFQILPGVLIIAAAACAPDAESYSSPALSAAEPAYSSTSLSTVAVEAAATVEQTEGFYAHSTLHIRAEPKANASIVRTLARGDYMQLGARDGNGWAGLYTGGVREGYVYRASDAVRRSAPEAVTSSTPQSLTSSRGRRRSSAESRRYHRGLRGGCYFYTSSGRKEYVDRSLCN